MGVRHKKAVLAVAAVAVAAALGGQGYPASASDSAAASAAQPPDILSAPTLVAHTADGNVGYREVGHGSTILLLMGLAGSLDNWAPSFVDTLAGHHRVVLIDNAGVGDTTALSAPLTITEMAQQTSAFIATLRLHRPAVLGWSMGGLIAQALAVLHPAQVGRLILCATQTGDGRSLPVPQSTVDQLGSTNLTTLIGLLFPPDQEAAGLAYFKAIAQYPGLYAAPADIAAQQLVAGQNWIAGDEPAGHLNPAIRVQALVADGTEDEFDPTSNAYVLAHSIRGARLVLYPDAGHGFLFQDASAFLPVVERFLGR